MFIIMHITIFYNVLPVIHPESMTIGDKYVLIVSPMHKYLHIITGFSGRTLIMIYDDTIFFIFQ